VLLLSWDEKCLGIGEGASVDGVASPAVWVLMTGTAGVTSWRTGSGVSLYLTVGTFGSKHAFPPLIMLVSVPTSGEIRLYTEENAVNASIGGLCMAFWNGEGVGSGLKFAHFLPVGGSDENFEPLLRDGSLMEASILTFSVGCGLFWLAGAGAASGSVVALFLLMDIKILDASNPCAEGV